jgi:modification methylase
VARRVATETSSFGVSRRESHDAAGFYRRFTPPRLTDDETVTLPAPDCLDQVVVRDARDMREVKDGSVALVVTSPPYFAGKEYEQVLGEGHVPATYLGYLQLLEEVLGQCAAKLEPGGRLAVNVANLGRKPYRSLSSDVIAILQDRLGLLLRGEIVWVKGKGAGGSCAWGSFQSPANPVLRDLTERVVVAGKGRFDRAVAREQRRARGLPFEATVTKDEFMAATTDVWEMAPERATRVGHPAPFPVELPQRLIELYTYRDDLVLDPFMGSGSTAVAAVRSGRHFVGYETDAAYAATARRRAEEAASGLRKEDAAGRRATTVARAPSAQGSVEPPLQAALRTGAAAKEVARALLEECGFADISRPFRSGGAEADLQATDAAGRDWLFAIWGGFGTVRGGLRKPETLWRALGKAAVLSAAGCERLVLLTTELPQPSSLGSAALDAVRGGVIFDAVEMLTAEGYGRLSAIAAGDASSPPR